MWNKKGDISGSAVTILIFCSFLEKKKDTFP